MMLGVGHVVSNSSIMEAISGVCVRGVNKQIIPPIHLLQMLRNFAVKEKCSKSHSCCSARSACPQTVSKTPSHPPHLHIPFPTRHRDTAK